MTDRLTAAEVDRIAEVVEHRIGWLREGYLPEDLVATIRRLVRHAQATTRRRKR